MLVVIDEFRPNIECNEVFLLSTLRTSYLQHLKDVNEEYHCMYTSQKLKVKLENKWPLLAFFPRKEVQI